MSPRLIAVALCSLSAGIVLCLIGLVVGGSTGVAIGALLALLVGSLLAGLAASTDEGRRR